MIPNLNKQKKLIILILFYSFSLLVALLTFKDYGVHIEEKFHRLNGHYWLNYIAKVFDLNSIQQITEVKLSEISDYTLSSVARYNKYSVILDVPSALLEISMSLNDPKEIYYLKHILSFSIFLFSSYFFFKILEYRYNNFYLSFAGLIFYLTTPRIIGDSFLYKDVLFLSFFTITFYFLHKSLINLNFKNLVFFSLFTALSINLRVFAILIPFLFLFIILIKSFFLKDFTNTLKKILFYFFCFIFFLILFWPYLWSNPLNNFLDIFVSIKQDLINIKIFYDGEYVSNQFLPETYLTNWLFISSPIAHTILFFLGFFFYSSRILNRFFKIKANTIYNDLWRGRGEEIDFIFYFFLISFYFFFMVLNAPLYNGWRLVYFLNIFIIYFVINYLSLLIKSYRSINFYKIVFTLMVLMIGYNFFALVKTHPYQSIYFNTFLSEKTKNSYEGDYYGLATKHFFEKIITEDNRKIINVAVASHTPIQRGLESLPKNVRKKINVVGQEYELANYIFKNNISEVNAKLIKKYKIPENFSKIYELKIDRVVIYEIYKLNSD